MADQEREPERSPDLPFQAEGFREYVAGIDPATAADMEAVIEQLEHAAEEPAPEEPAAEPESPPPPQ